MTSSNHNQEFGFVKLPTYVEVFTGFKIIPESDQYKIRPESHSGTLKYFDENGAVVERRFHLVNLLCTPEGAKLFNVSVLNALILKKFSDALTGSNVRFFSVVWERDTGFSIA
jgi:hypothetical protein